MKTLVVYASAGVGHKKAAEAVYKAYKDNAPETEVVLLDMLDKCTWLTRRAYPGLYIFAVKHVAWVWAFLFNLTNNRIFYRITNWLKLFIESSNAGEFMKYLRDEEFDVIVSTHFYSSSMAGILKRKGLIKSRLITVVTDYRVHSYWLTLESEKFLAASQQTKDDLIKDGISPEKIEVTGIPSDLKFSKKLDRNTLEEKLALFKRELTVLIMGGGFGVGPYEFLLEKLSVFKEKLGLIFVCGYNEDLYKRLEVLAEKIEYKIKLLGYADNVEELMQASDLIITKAGGITLTESLVSGLPAVVIKPIPGQEEGNAGYLASKGAVVSKKTPQAIVDFISLVLENRKILEKMKTAALAEAHPKAAARVVEIAEKIS